MRLAAERDADADVIRVLRENGDAQHLRRAVDVRFVGRSEDIASLADGIADAGWTVIQVIELGGGQAALDIQRDQTTEAKATEALTVEALRFEQAYRVRYDGWGAVAIREG